MKKTFLLSLILSGVSFAGFEVWTSADGRSAELELVRVVEKNGEKSGEFRMRGGQTTTIAASKLAEADAIRLAEWTPEAATEAEAEAAPPSVYDDILEGNLLSLQGRSLKRVKDHAKPTKYYVFYRTASWCGPCIKFTPQLVDFYNEKKDETFEVVVITSDSNEDAMEEYAKAKEMPWPHLKLRKVEDFKEDFPDKGTGIPYLVVADLDGKIIAESNAYSLFPKLEQLLSD